jgi:hypothetical protein
MKASCLIGLHSVFILACLGMPDSTRAASQVIAWGDTRQGTPAGLTNSQSVAAGSLSSLALNADGTVIAWGVLSATNVPAGLTNVVSTDAGDSEGLALKADGTVTAWGTGLATKVPAGLSNLVAVASGSSHGLALNQSGQIFAWGDGSKGQTNVPPGLSHVVAVAAGFQHSLALKADGTVIAWGTGPETNVPAGLSHVVAIAAGGDKGGGDSLALKADGTVTAWGANASGQTNVPLNLSNVVALAAGGAHCLALKNDGTVTGWGYNNYGQAQTTGLSNVVAIAAGGYHSLVLEQAGLSVLRQPRGQIAGAASPVELNVLAAGRPPLTFQWTKNGTNLPGAVASYLVLTNVARQDSATYAVLVTDANGSTLSSNAVLKVLVPQVLGTPARLPDGTVRLTSNDAGGGLLAPSDLTHFEAQASTNLAGWMTLSNSLTLANGFLLLHDTNATLLPQRFYRILEH